MAEQTFRSPGFFEQEIDLSARRATPLGTPAGVIGTAERGPAFVPVTLGSLADFEARFGSLHRNRFGPYAVREFLKNKTSLTYIRVLGAGSNETTSDITTTDNEGTVKHAGFRLVSTALGVDDKILGGHKGVVQFLCATHALRTIDGGEPAGYPVFSDNDSFAERGGDDKVNLVRAVLFTPTGSRLEVFDGDQQYANYSAALDDVASPVDIGSGAGGHFKLAISSSVGTSFANDEGYAGVRIYTASLDPNDGQYIGKILNTDPHKFQEEHHLLYLDFAVEDEIASVGTVASSVAILSGSDHTTSGGGDTSTSFLDLFGRFDTRYSTPRTPSIISQPYGSTEFDLFHFETISDGAWGNDKFKVSIANLRASVDPNNDFGIFEVQVRRFSDTDHNKEIIEAFPECSLNPNHESYVARKIGDKKVYWNFDATDEDEQRLVIRGKYPNRSSRIRIVMNSAVEEEKIPADALPFGFRGVPVLKTSDSMMDLQENILTDNKGTNLGESRNRISGHFAALAHEIQALSGSIVPPLPMRFKCTRGAVDSTPTNYLGEVGTNERADSRLYWGIKFERLPVTSSAPGGSVTNANLKANQGGLANPLVSAYAKFNGIQKLDTLVTGSGADYFNNNKFTLARVALYNQLSSGHITDVSGTAKEHMLESSYVRNGNPNASTYVVDDSVRKNRISLATLIHSSSTVFNRFTEYAKFTTMFYGGFDGLNILDKDSHLMNDRASSSDAGGKAQAAGSVDIGLPAVATLNQMGEGKKNNVVNSFRVATRIITDPMASNINILAIPGMRDTFITDHALERVKDYSMAFYLMDVLKYDAAENRLFDDDKNKVDVREVAEQLDSRALDNNYAATYFPDVFVKDPVNGTTIKVPASVAAFGALAFNDKVSFPWFAPAGFNRGSLENVANVDVRLNSADRDTLYDARINPIAVFPAGGFVIFGQKTLQMAKSALDRVNVRRMLLEVKRLVVQVANRLLFEQNNSSTRARFVNQVTPLLALVQAQAGIESFNVVCDATNNSSVDVEANKMNGRIVVVPTRAVEFIAVDFIVTNSGVSFE